MDYLIPDEPNDPGVIVVIREIVIQCGEAVSLALFFHCAQLPLIEFRTLDVSPVKLRRIHWETRSHGSVRAHDDIALPRPAVPVCEVKLTIGVLHDPGHGSDLT